MQSSAVAVSPLCTAFQSRCLFACELNAPRSSTVAQYCLCPPRDQWNFWHFLRQKCAALHRTHCTTAGLPQCAQTSGMTPAKKIDLVRIQARRPWSDPAALAP